MSMSLQECRSTKVLEGHHNDLVKMTIFVPPCRTLLALQSSGKKQVRLTTLVPLTDFTPLRYPDHASVDAR